MLIRARAARTSPCTRSARGRWQPAGPRIYSASESGRWAAAAPVITRCFLRRLTLRASSRQLSVPRSAEGESKGRRVLGTRRARKSVFDSIIAHAPVLFACEGADLRELTSRCKPSANGEGSSPSSQPKPSIQQQNYGGTCYIFLTMCTCESNTACRRL